MNTRQAALIEVNNLQRTLTNYQLAVDGNNPNDDTDPLNRDLRDAIEALNTIILPLQRKLAPLKAAIDREAKAAPTAALPDKLLTDLIAVATECDNLYKSPEAKTFQQRQIAVQLNIVQTSLGIINSFEIDYQQQAAVKALKAQLVRIDTDLTNLRNNPDTITDKRINELSVEVDTITDAPLSALKADNARVQEANTRFAEDINEVIKTLVVPPATQVQLDALLDAKGKAALTDLVLSNKLDVAHELLLSRKKAVETAHRELTTARDTLVQPANVSKAAILKRLRTDGLYLSGKTAASEITRGITEAETAVKDATAKLQQAALNALKPVTDQAIIKIDEKIASLNDLAKDVVPPENDVVHVSVKLEIKRLILILEQYKADLKDPTKTNQFKNKDVDALLNTDDFKKAIKIENTAECKKDIVKITKDLKNDIKLLENDDAVTSFKTELEAFTLKLTPKSRQLDNAYIDQDDLDKINAALDHYFDGIDSYDDSLDAYRTAAEAKAEVEETIDNLDNTFTDRATAPADVIQLFADLEQEQAMLETQLEAIKKGQLALLDIDSRVKADKDALQDIIDDVKSDDTTDAHNDLKEKAEDAISKQEIQAVRDATAKKATDAIATLTADIKTVVDQIDAALKEAETLIKEIKGFDSTAKDAIEAYGKTLKGLKNHLKEIIDNHVINPTSPLKTEADDVLAAAIQLKTAAEKTKTDEDLANPTSTAKVKIADLKKDADAKVKKVKKILTDLRAIKIDAYDKDARDDIKKRDELLIPYEKELAELEEKLKNIDAITDIPSTVASTAKVDPDVDAAIKNKEAALTEIDALEQKLTVGTYPDTKKTLAQTIDDFQTAVIARKNIASSPYLSAAAAIPSYPYTVSNPKKSFEMLDKHLMAHVNALNYWKKIVFTATASGTAKNNLTDDEKTNIADKARELKRALLFYKAYNLDPSYKHKGLNRNDFVQEQIDILDKIEEDLKELSTDQQYILKGRGVLGVKYYDNLEDAVKDFTTPLYKPTPGGAISIESGRVDIEKGKQAIRSDHQMRVIKADGSPETFTNKSVLHFNPSTSALQLNFYEDKTAAEINQIPDIVVRKIPSLEKISNPPLEYGEEALVRIQKLRSHPDSKGGAIFIHPGMPYKKCEAMILACKSQGIKIDPACYTLIDPNPNTIKQNKVILFAKRMEDRGFISVKTAAEIEEKHENAISRFRKP